MKQKQTEVYEASDMKAGMNLGELSQIAFQATEQMGTDTEVVADISFRGRIKRLAFNTPSA